MTDLPELLERLVRRGETVATAESLTGGLVCARLVDAPGASLVVRGGIVAYAAQVKTTALGVPADLIASRGTVDATVALAMADGVRQALSADWGIATTGVAGPGPAEGKAVGTAYVAVVGPDVREVRRRDCDGGRSAIRAAVVDAAIAMLAEHAT